jgi:hypothetical protein
MPTANHASRAIGAAGNRSDALMLGGKVIVFTGHVEQHIKWDGEKVVYRPVSVEFDYPRFDLLWPVDHHHYTYRWYRV